jgi:hypothetical protein
VTTSVSITIPPKIQISGLSNIAVPEFTGSGDSAASDDVCVYSNNATGNYQVTATGSGTGGAFVLDHATLSETVPYTAKWNDASGTTGNQALSSGVPLANQGNASSSALDCAGVPNANLEISVSEASMKANPSGNYQGNMAVLVEPE